MLLHGFHTASLGFGPDTLMLIMCVCLQKRSDRDVSSSRDAWDAAPFNAFACWRSCRCLSITLDVASFKVNMQGFAVAYIPSM